ncbi:unnamed protein product [Orchesella dallaii]|uniref:Transmembrane protein n=1 Tax=Orchesella dallaii TaxID=48710 RepID=A0ABP1Q1Q3_9HEXA
MSQRQQAPKNSQTNFGNANEASESQSKEESQSNEWRNRLRPRAPLSTTNSVPKVAKPTPMKVRKRSTKINGDNENNKHIGKGSDTTEFKDNGVLSQKIEKPQENVAEGEECAGAVDADTDVDENIVREANIRKGLLRRHYNIISLLVFCIVVFVLLSYYIIDPKKLIKLFVTLL